MDPGASAAVCVDENTVAAFLDHRLAPDARAQVEQHLDGCESCRRWLSSFATLYSLPGAAATWEPGPAPQPPREPHPGARVGRYLITERVGNGAMGVVYEARDVELDRKVALKLLRPGVRSSELRDQALREAQVMARLAHPHVMAVYEVGPAGEDVFIAMEYGDGGTLRQWLAAARRSRREIMALLLEAGSGLAAAHAAGLVHRDFKPDNVLLGRDGRARVTDFGLARILAEPGVSPGAPPAPSSSELSRTCTGTLLGTPAYMAPEQHAGASADEKADQFSFCVTLYEALYGELPFAGDSLEDLSWAVRQGRLRQAPPGADVPGWLRRALLQGLQPQPERRFQSLDALLSALHGPRPRKRWLLAAAAGLTLVLGAGAAAVLHRGPPFPWCGRAREHLSGVWDETRAADTRRALLHTGKPYAQGAWAEVKRALDAYAQGWASLYEDTCQSAKALGDKADPLLSQRILCLERRRNDFKALDDLLASADDTIVQNAAQSVHGLPPLSECAPPGAAFAAPPPPQDPALREPVEQARLVLSRAHALYRTGKYKDGLVLAREVLAQARKLAYAPLTAEALYALASLQSNAGDLVGTEKTLREAAKYASEAHDDRVLLKTWNALISIAGSREGLAHLELGLQWAEASAALLKRLGGDDLLQGSLEERLGSTLTSNGRYEEGLGHLRRSLALREKTNGPESMEATLVMMNIAQALRVTRHPDEAKAYYQRILKVQEKILGPEHPVYAKSLDGLALLEKEQGHFDAAITHLRQVKVLLQRSVSPDHPWVADADVKLAGCLGERGQTREALSLIEEALALRRKRFPPGHPSIGVALNRLGRLLMDKGDAAGALARFTESIELFKKASGPENTDYAEALDGAGDSLGQQGRWSEALARHVQALKIVEARSGVQSPDCVPSLVGIGLSELELKQGRLALDPLARALALAEKEPRDESVLADARFALARALAFTEDPSERPGQLASLALATYEHFGAGREAQLGQVRKWLAAHP